MQSPGHTGQPKQRKAMKTLLKVCAGAAIILAGCRNDPTQSEPYKQLEEVKQEVVEQNVIKDSTINEMFGAFNRISENLRMIREKQGLIGLARADVETGGTMEDGIMEDLRAIDSLLSANRAMVARMKRSAAASDTHLSELAKTIEDLERSMREKDAEIGSIKEQLASSNASLASMIRMYQDKEQQASMQQEELNSAWYCIGTAKELRDNKILTKEGGIIGIGRVSKLRTADLNTDYFKEIDLTGVSSIPLNVKKAKVVTSHPAGSYELSGTKDNVEALIITDAASFWSLSKYLVIEVD